jgi:steroid delta-isomerase-like uncharacterized protein
MTTEQNKAVINRFMDEVLNQWNFEVMDQIVAEDFVEELPFPGQGPGRTGLRDVIKAFHAAFPDMHWTVEEQIAEGDKVVTRFNFTGTQRGAFLGIPPSGKSVSVWGVVIDVVQNGLFTRSRIIMDMPSLLIQLGAMPAPH